MATLPKPILVFLSYLFSTESIMYLYRATGDPWLIDAGLDILRSIQHSAYTPCGYATVKVYSCVVNPDANPYCIRIK